MRRGDLSQAQQATPNREEQVSRKKLLLAQSWQYRLRIRKGLLDSAHLVGDTSWEGSETRPQTLRAVWPACRWWRRVPVAALAGMVVSVARSN